MFVFDPESRLMNSTGRYTGASRPDPARRVIILTGTGTAETQKLPAQILKMQLESFHLIKPENYNVY